jgi:hypothetical protein
LRRSNDARQKYVGGSDVVVCDFRCSFRFIQMKLSERDVSISFLIRNMETTKRRGGIYYPRKGGGKSNMLFKDKTKDSHKSPETQLKPPIISHVVPADKNPNPSNNIKPPSNPNPSHNVKPSRSSRPSSAPQIRVRQTVQKPPDPPQWDKSTYYLDREYLTIVQDNKISKYRKSEWGSIAHPPSCSLGGADNQSDRRTISSSYSRNRPCKTSGPALNHEANHVGFNKNLMERVEAADGTGIHLSKWNVSTKDFDEPQRAKPLEIPDKMSSQHLMGEYYAHDQLEVLHHQGEIVQTQRAIPREGWDITKDPSRHLPGNSRAKQR